MAFTKEDKQTQKQEPKPEVRYKYLLNNIQCEDMSRTIGKGGEPDSKLRMTEQTKNESGHGIVNTLRTEPNLREKAIIAYNTPKIAYNTPKMSFFEKLGRSLSDRNDRDAIGMALSATMFGGFGGFFTGAYFWPTISAPTNLAAMCAAGIAVGVLAGVSFSLICTAILHWPESQSMPRLLT